MKNKPTRHKDSNTFKFKPFSERVNDIDVDIYHKVRHRNEEFTEETETYFNQCLQKWNFLNLSENYSNFRKEVSDIITLPQLLNRKEFVIDILLKYLNLKDPLCLQTIFDLVTAVAQDLQNDFYPYFPQFLTTIVELLSTKDAEQLEYTFTTLAYLFKSQWRYMIENIDVIFNLLVPLLADTRPKYINNFAAESFAFVVRKVKDKEAFLKLVLVALEKKQDGISGCGKLLFYILAGVPGQFHSCAETMFTVYLSALQDKEINQELLYKVLESVFNCITSEIHSQKCDVLWIVIFKLLNKFNESSIVSLLKLTQIIVSHKGGYMLRDPITWAKKLVELIDKYGNDLVLEEIANASATTLLAPNVKLLQETSSFLVLKLLSIENQDLLLQVTEKLITYSAFETIVLPNILRKSSFSTLDEKVLELLVKIIQAKSPPKMGGINFKKWTKYSLNIRGDNNFEFLSNHLDTLREGEVQESALKSLIIIPHLTVIQEKLRPKVIEIVKTLYKRVLEKTDQQQKTNFAFLLTVECVARIIKPDDFDTLVKEVYTEEADLLKAVTLHENDALVLNSLDLILTYLNSSSNTEEYINKEVFDKIHKSLVSKLGSPNAQIRLTISHLISLFANVPIIGHESTDPTFKPALILPYLAESEPTTVHKYRDRLLHIQSMEFNSQSINHLNSDYHDIPLHYLFGNLYVNFSLLWDPVCKTIATYATKSCTQFWQVFMQKLNDEENANVVELPRFEFDVLNKLSEKVGNKDDKVDFKNYKLLLWKCMGMIAGYCEVKNRDFVGLFIEFVEGNFFKANSEDAKSCSIRKREQEVVDVSKDDNVDKDDTVDVAMFEDLLNEKVDDDSESKIKVDEQTKEKEEDEEDDDEKSPKHLGRADRVKFLVAMLQVFSKFTNTRSLYREPEILKIYQDLLSSKNSEIQKAALACLYTYKFKYLVPYKSHLDNIVDEKNLKNELARFQISVSESSDDTVVQDDHREDLMPVLMRILYAKMTQRVGMRTGGKAGGLVRRKAILRFLAGVKEDEMMVFVRMAFKPFQKYLPILNVDTTSETETINLTEMVESIIESINLETVIPPKRLQSAVNLLAIIIEQFGGKMTQKLLPHLLAIVICILAQVTGILSKSAEVHSGYLTSLKNVRNSCINVLTRFFVHFENYDWSSDEIDAMFNVAVLPWIEKLPIEGIHSPTPLMKMLSSWSHNPRYYPLFVKIITQKKNDKDDQKSQDNESNKTSLLYVVQLLLGQKTHRSVLNTILDMVEKMLTLQDFEKENPEQMEVDNKPSSLLPIVRNKLDIKCSDTINYGSAMLLPHVTDILKFIERKLKRQTTKQGASRTELVILSRISEFVTDPATCDTLLTLVLPILNRKSNYSEETVTQLLTTVTNLVKHVNKPDLHLRQIQHLLSQLSAAPTRKMLMELLDMVAKGNEVLLKNQKVLKELNAYDQRWIEQPDFQRRLDAFELIDKMIKEDDVTLEFGVAIILNCFFFLKTENDLAMRDRSGICLKSIGLYLCKRYNNSPQDRKYLIEDTILQMVRHGIRNKVDNVKLQSIAFLGYIAMECPEVHPVLRDLHPLTNKQDPEVDFFENMQHLQLHRKARALLKFCNVARQMTKAPNPRTLTQFILPLATSFLCNEKYTNKNSLIDAGIETVGVVCRLLPWNQYELVLKHYLDKLRTCLDFQRQVIRIVVGILDAFHFDLVKYKEVKNVAGKGFKFGKGKRGRKVEEIPEKEEVQPEVIELIELSTPTEDTEKPDEPELEPEELNDENLDEALNNEAIIEESATEEPELQEVKEIPAVEKQTVLSLYMAKRLVNSITHGLMPQLHKAIAVRTKYESSHKANKKKATSEQEDEELMRVPIALAMVKLLQKLPSGMLDGNLRGIFTKICTFLRSRLESVRRTTREILQKIMITLGPDYLHHLFKEMNALLTRGYQVHVLVFTIHAVLVSLKPFFEPRHMRSNLNMILSVCKIDMFGPSAEEKEIAGIIKNVSEAKSTKSFDIFHILGEFIDKDALIDVVLPLKEVLIRTRSHKPVRKITEAFRQLGLGLADNKNVSMRDLLQFLYGIASESIPQLMPENNKKNEEAEKKKKIEAAKQKKDCFIIQPEPKNKMGIKALAKTSKNTNAHVMSEFGLRLFHILLKRDKIGDEELKDVLDPFVPVLSDCLKSQHVKLSTLALQCLNWILKMDLPQVHSLVSEICSSIFKILHKYAAAGLSKGDNYDLVMAAFKTMSVLVRDIKHFEISPNQIKILLMYAEQDLYDSDKQATAFGLLKAIIHRKVIVPEIHEVMKKVAVLSVESELENVRKQARTVFYIFMVDYPQGKKLNEHIEFYLDQLKYEVQPGRLSALDMIYSIVTSFPLKVLIKYASFILIKVTPRLVDDEDPICKKACARCIKEMIERLEYNQRSKLFDIVITWLQGKELLFRRLAVQVSGIFVTVEKDSFESRLKELLPLLTKQFYTGNCDEENESGRFVKMQKQETNEVYDEKIKDAERLKDHHLFILLQCLLKISSNCTMFLRDQKYKEHIDTYAEYSQSFLAHPHLWVRLAASQLLGFIFAALDTNKVVHLLKNPNECDPDSGFIYSDPLDKLRSLVLDSIAQLQPDTEFEELYDQIIKNLIFIARLLNIKSPQQDENKDDKTNKNKDGKTNETEDDKTNTNDISLLWLLKKLRKCINVEITQCPRSKIVRSSVFKWMAGVLETIDIELLKPILFHFMSPLVREMATIEESNAPLRQLAKEVATKIKKKTSVDEYAKLLSQAQQRLDTRRAERRKVRSQQFVTDPESAAKRKIAKQQKKKVARKRKMDTMKGKKGSKYKKPKKDLDLEDIGC